MAGFIDTHAHLSMLSPRGINTEQMLTELFSGGFGGIIDIGTGAEDLPGRIEAYRGFEKVRYSAGIWPSAEAIARRGEGAAFLERHIREAPAGLVCAVGECGIDRHWNRAEKGADITGERELLEMQLDMASRLGLPVIIHTRDAPEETAEILAAHRGIPRIVHCFSYGAEAARRFLDLGCFISFAGNCTFKNAGDIREALRLVPADRLLLETDCPYLAPVPHRGKPADPGMVEDIYRFVSDLKGINPESLLEQIAQNTRDVFNIRVVR